MIITMGTLQILKSQFEEASKQFPGLTHVSENCFLCKKHYLPPEYRYTKDNLVKLWEHNGLDESGKLVIVRRHWLIRPEGENWNTVAAYRRLRKLAERGIEHLSYVTFIRDEYYKSAGIADASNRSSEALWFKGEEEYNHIDPDARWPIELYAYQRDYQWKLLISRSPTVFRSLGGYAWMMDVFLESVIFCEKMIDDLKRYGDGPKQEVTSDKTPPEKQKKNERVGRPSKYRDNIELLKRVQATYEKVYETQKNKDSKAAWNKAAEIHGMTSGDAARQACRRYLKSEKSTK